MKTDDPPISYRKRCRQVGLTSGSALYEADDHLLLVEGWLRQRCRRFHFDKIQAIVVRPTFKTAIELIVTGTMLTFLIGITVLVTFNLPPDDDEMAALVGMVMLTIPFLVIFLFSLVRFLIRGASQDVYFKTAVQSTRVTPLGLRRAAKHHLEEIRQIIENAQGGPLTPDSLKSRLSNAEAHPPAFPQITPPDLPPA